MLIVKYEVLSYGFSQGLSSGFPLQPNTQICPHHKKHIRTSYPNVWAYGIRTILIVVAIHSWPAPCHDPFQNTTNSFTGAGDWHGNGLTWQWYDVTEVNNWHKVVWLIHFLNTLTKICQKYLNHVLYTIDIRYHHNRYYYIHTGEKTEHGPVTKEP